MITNQLEEDIINKRLKQKIVELSIDTLSAKEFFVLMNLLIFEGVLTEDDILYYYNKKTKKDLIACLAHLLNVTEVRIRQINKNAINKLKDRLSFDNLIIKSNLNKNIKYNKNTINHKNNKDNGGGNGFTQE
ncbi:hypothetical protein [Deferribacter desulfuricans]|uniref:hypothetical protein n=1 Tax=Deferribacter desulfuricans TaxID=197162 RepID=UPI00129BB4F0|nr:hypothetical protein [Deferribacter desulfuricans]